MSAPTASPRRQRAVWRSIVMPHRLAARAMVALTMLCLALAMTGPAMARGPQSAEPPRPRPQPVALAPMPSGDALLARTIAAADLDGETAAVLYDVDSGEILEAHHPSLPLPPASVTKLVTTLYGLDRLGPGFGFRTQVIATGPLQGGLISGDLVLAGGGDPELDSDELADMAKALADAGVRGVTGRFLFYDGALARLRRIDEGQPPNAAYNPGLSGLNLNFNRVFFEWKPGEDAIDLRLEARAETHSPPVSTMRIVAEERPAPVYLYSEQGGADHWSIARGALKKAGGTWLPVRDPGTYAADAFAQIARDYGILLPHPQRTGAPPEGRLMVATYRRPLNEVCRGMLHFSTNVTAELIGLTASGLDGPAAGLAESAARMQAWTRNRFGIASPVFHDHSGLSEANRISAGDMARLVRDASRDGLLEGLLRQHFVAAPGSNKPAVREAEVRAKTGTLNFVRALSGTIEGARGQRLAFAIMSADLPARAGADHSLTHPPGVRGFNNRAVSLEQRILAQWLTRYAR